MIKKLSAILILSASLSCHSFDLPEHLTGVEQLRKACDEIEAEPEGFSALLINNPTLASWADSFIFQAPSNTWNYLLIHQLKDAYKLCGKNKGLFILLYHVLKTENGPVSVGPYFATIQAFYENHPGAVAALKQFLKHSIDNHFTFHVLQNIHIFDHVIREYGVSFFNQRINQLVSSGYLNRLGVIAYHICNHMDNMQFFFLELMFFVIKASYIDNFDNLFTGVETLIYQHPSYIISMMETDNEQDRFEHLFYLLSISTPVNLIMSATGIRLSPGLVYAHNYVNLALLKDSINMLALIALVIFNSLTH